jgi:adenylyl-sulfate kinase
MPEINTGGRGNQSSRPPDASSGPQRAVTAVQRERQNGHAGCVVWLTGLSAAGKSTVACELERQLFARGRHVYVLDGDVLRRGLCADLGYSSEARTENIRRAGEVARLLADAGIICVAAFISPYRADRDAIRARMPDRRFIEVFVDSPLAVCEARDPKGLYARARAGKVGEFTGISAPYEPPLHPEIVLPTDQITPGEAAARIVQFLDSAGVTHDGALHASPTNRTQEVPRR